MKEFKILIALLVFTIQILKLVRSDFSGIRVSSKTLRIGVRYDPRDALNSRYPFANPDLKELRTTDRRKVLFVKEPNDRNSYFQGLPARKNHRTWEISDLNKSIQNQKLSAVRRFLGVNRNKRSIVGQSGNVRKASAISTEMSKFIQKPYPILAFEMGKRLNRDMKSSKRRYANDIRKRTSYRKIHPENTGNVHENTDKISSRTRIENKNQIMVGEDRRNTLKTPRNDIRNRISKLRDLIAFERLKFGQELERRRETLMMKSRRELKILHEKPQNSESVIQSRVTLRIRNFDETMSKNRNGRGYRERKERRLRVADISLPSNRIKDSKCDVMSQRVRVSEIRNIEETFFQCRRNGRRFRQRVALHLNTLDMRQRVRMNAKLNGRQKSQGTITFGNRNLKEVAMLSRNEGRFRERTFQYPKTTETQDCFRTIGNSNGRLPSLERIASRKINIQATLLKNRYRRESREVFREQSKYTETRHARLINNPKGRLIPLVRTESRNLNTIGTLLLNRNGRFEERNVQNSRAMKARQDLRIDDSSNRRMIQSRIVFRNTRETLSRNRNERTFIDRHDRHFNTIETAFRLPVQKNIKEYSLRTSITFKKRSARENRNVKKFEKKRRQYVENSKYSQSIRIEKTNRFRKTLSELLGKKINEINSVRNRNLKFGDKQNLNNFNFEKITHEIQILNELSLLLKNLGKNNTVSSQIFFPNNLIESLDKIKIFKINELSSIFRSISSDKQQRFQNSDSGNLNVFPSNIRETSRIQRNSFRTSSKSEVRIKTGIKSLNQLNHRSYFSRSRTLVRALTTLKMHSRDTKQRQIFLRNLKNIRQNLNSPFNTQATSSLRKRINSDEYRKTIENEKRRTIKSNINNLTRKKLLRAATQLPSRNIEKDKRLISKSYVQEITLQRITTQRSPINFKISRTTAARSNINLSFSSPLGRRITFSESRRNIRMENNHLEKFRSNAIKYQAERKTPGYVERKQRHCGVEKKYFTKKYTRASNNAQRLIPTLHTNIVRVKSNMIKTVTGFNENKNSLARPLKSKNYVGEETSTKAIVMVLLQNNFILDETISSSSGLKQRFWSNKFLQRFASHVNSRRIKKSPKSMKMSTIPQAGKKEESSGQFVVKMVDMMLPSLPFRVNAPKTLSFMISDEVKHEGKGILKIGDNTRSSTRNVDGLFSYLKNRSRRSYSIVSEVILGVLMLAFMKDDPKRSPFHRFKNFPIVSQIL